MKRKQAVESARREFAEGDHTAAIKRLEGLEITHPLVAATLAELRQEAESVKRRLEMGPEEVNPAQIAALQRREATEYVNQARQKHAARDDPKRARPHRRCARPVRGPPRRHTAA